MPASTCRFAARGVLKPRHAGLGQHQSEHRRVAAGPAARARQARRGRAEHAADDPGQPGQHRHRRDHVDPVDQGGRVSGRPGQRPHQARQRGKRQRTGNPARHRGPPLLPPEQRQANPFGRFRLAACDRPVARQPCLRADGRTKIYPAQISDHVTGQVHCQLPHRAMLVLQHVDCEPPAEYEDVLIERGIGVERVLLADGGVLPDWRDFAGVIVMGGPMGAHDTGEFAWLAPELALIREAASAGCPLWGVCLGAQLLASALGARVWPGPRPEVGVCQVGPTRRRAARPGVRRPHRAGAGPAMACGHVRPAVRRRAPGQFGRSTRTRPSGWPGHTGSSSTSR